MSSKSRVGTRLKQAIGTSKSTNQSSDLITATNNFETMKKRLKLLIAALKSYHQSLTQVQKARTEAVKLLATLSLNSPIFEFTGELSNDSGNSPLSYASVHSTMSAQQKKFSDKYSEHVVKYAVEWERILTERISTGLKKAESLRFELDHYEKKVQSIRVNVNVTMAKGKMVDPKASERLRRNEEKFAAARLGYQRFVHALCVLVDESTLRSWKDLHPLLVKMAQFDLTISSEEAKALSNLNVVVGKLNSFAQAHGVGQSRLRDLQSMDAYQLSGMNEEEYLALNAPPAVNNQLATSAASDTNNNFLEFATAPSNLTPTPSTLSNWDPQMVQQYSSNNSNTNTNNLSFSPVDTPNSLDMLNVVANSAPAPTMQTLNDATNSLSLSNRRNSDNHLGLNSNSFGGGDYNNSSGYSYNPSQPTPNHPMLHAPAPRAPPPPPPSGSQSLTIHSSSNGTYSNFDIHNNNRHGSMNTNHNNNMYPSYGQHPQTQQQITPYNLPHHNSAPSSFDYHQNNTNHMQQQQPPFSPSSTQNSFLGSNNSNGVARNPFDDF